MTDELGLQGSDESMVDNDVELLIGLERITEELRNTLSADQRAVRLTAPEAADALRQLLQGEAGSTPVVYPRGTNAWLSSARTASRLLEMSPEVGPIAKRVRGTSSAELQMGVEVADASVVVLGLLITWVQTKVDFHVKRRNGKVDFDFRVAKDASRGPSLGPVIDAIRKALSPGNG